jgi:tetratricopeptide (TPR) repeat protein
MLMLGSLAALALGTAEPLPWQAAFHESSETVAPAQDTNALLKAYDSAMFGKRFDEALAIARKFESAGPEGQAYVAAMQASALVGLKRDSEARALVAKAKELAPSSPDSSRVMFLGGLLTDRPDVAADALDRMIAIAPDMVRELNWEWIRFFLGHEPKGQDSRNEDRRIALARIGYGGETEVGHWRAANAVDILVKRGDFSGAGEFLEYVNEPRAFENMLIQRRYAALWPQLETLAGPHLEKIREASLRSARAEYASAPDDHDKLQLLANALRHAGRFDEAMALRAKLPATSAEMSLADEPMGWAVNNVALAFHEAGRADDADRLFALLNDAPMPKEYWRISMKINRLELLVMDGKFDQALPLVEPTAKTEGSPYADQLVRRLRYCTLSSVGRNDEAAKYLPDLLGHAADAPGPTIDGLLCAGELDKAEQVALDSLNGEKKDSFAEDFLRQLQTHQLTSDDPSVWQGRWQELRARPAIREAFDRLGRDLPPQLLPPPPTHVPAK